jgi:Tat protein translocase TatB subunit
MFMVTPWPLSQGRIEMNSVFGIGMNELMIVFLLATIVLGPERLVRVAREVGKFIRNVKGYLATFTDELKTELDVLDEVKKIKVDLEK